MRTTGCSVIWWLVSFNDKFKTGLQQPQNQSESLKYFLTLNNFLHFHNSVLKKFNSERVFFRSLQNLQFHCVEVSCLTWNEMNICNQILSENLKQRVANVSICWAHQHFRDGLVTLIKVQETCLGMYNKALIWHTQNVSCPATGRPHFDRKTYMFTAFTVNTDWLAKSQDHQEVSAWHLLSWPPTACCRRLPLSHVGKTMALRATIHKQHGVSSRAEMLSASLHMTMELNCQTVTTCCQELLLLVYGWWMSPGDFLCVFV